MHVVNTEEIFVSSVIISRRLSLFKGYPVFARLASHAGKINIFSHFILFLIPVLFYYLLVCW